MQFLKLMARRGSYSAPPSAALWGTEERKEWQTTSCGTGTYEDVPHTHPSIGEFLSNKHPSLHTRSAGLFDVQCSEARPPATSVALGDAGGMKSRAVKLIAWPYIDNIQELPTQFFVDGSVF